MIRPPSGYEGMESLDRFSSASELDDYRRGLLAKTELELGFIRREVGRRKLRVLELGAGGGRLLIALALAGMVRSGVGVELANSRVGFARRWAHDLGIGNLEFVVGDVLEPHQWLTGEFDLIVAISNLLGYLGPVRRDAPARVLQTCYRSLAPDGCMLLEFYQLTAERRQMLALSGERLRTWMPLPAWDRFAFSLSDLAYDPSTGVLHHEKIFIGRDGSIDAGRVEDLAFHTRADVLEWLRPEGCERHVAFRSYASAPYSDDATQVILLAGAPRWQRPSEAERDANDTAPVTEVRSDGPGAWV
jgi:SAM-dependent methyltransferase